MNDSDDRSGTAIGWKLDAASRADLLAHFPARYPETVADHVTLSAGVSAGTPLPPACTAEVVGRVDDGQGIKALVTAIDGATQRPDGGTSHITWSLAPGRSPSERNEAIVRLGWTRLSKRSAVARHPAWF
jgi:hypothetical protein